MTYSDERLMTSDREKVPPGRLMLRVLWIAVQLIVAYWLSSQSQPFFYQRF
jgi:hypothetical protein